MSGFYLKRESGGGPMAVTVGPGFKVVEGQTIVRLAEREAKRDAEK